MNKENFSTKLIEWYTENARTLPWRETKDPYKIWISEIILQQTRVTQGLPYYKIFIEEFPDVFDLANASEQKVLRLWQGLGYYSRARNLHKCAKTVVEKWNGKFPNSFEELKKLPGIGSYTAAAIASISFQEVVAVVDGNVFRVLSRVFGIDKDILSTEGKNFFFYLANQLISKRKPDVFNQALMEFGAMHCLPKNPKCDDCIFSSSCEAKQKSKQQQWPIKSKKQKIKTRYFYYFIIGYKNKMVMRQRSEKDIWQGLYDFYLFESTKSQKIERIIQNDIWLKNFDFHSQSKTITHLLSHQKLNVKFIELTAKTEIKISSHFKQNGFALFSKKQVALLPKPILIERYLSDRFIEN